MWIRRVLIVLMTMFLVAPPAVAEDTVGLVDPAAGLWQLRDGNGKITGFFYGNPGDFPMMGDWDCDGVDTPGLYRQSDGFVYLRNSNTQGAANIRFFFGNPGDIPLAGDFDGDGCDTVSIYRAPEARIYVINALGANDGGLGSADLSYVFGNPGDKPFVGDFDANGEDTVGLHRESTGFVYFRNSHTQGNANAQFFFGDPGDRLMAGDWGVIDGTDTPAVFRPSNTTFYFRHTNSQGNADSQFGWGSPEWLPVAGSFGALPGTGPGSGCPVFPANSIWNARVDALPVHTRSAQYVARIGATANVHADLGSGVWPPGSTSPIGIPYVTVGATQPDVPIHFTSWPGESDPGPYPVPANAPIEGGPASSGDRHVIVVDRDDCVLYEMFYAFPNGDGSWNAANGARYDLRSNSLRPAGWTSADAAGLPIYAGLVRYDEVVSGTIRHAIRFTAPETQSAYVWPARHEASSNTDPTYPPMGQRFRLKASFDTSGMSWQSKVIADAMKTYGIILADNGSPWYISGAPDERWDNDVLHELDVIEGSNFEAVDVSSLMADPNSGRVAG
ncbi:MAG TPA: hypothetical protein VFP67_07765 [Acidimicrobiia bacterium]|nr:hypothetical protein [Acidimicrobiia bacterium]